MDGFRSQAEDGWVSKGSAASYSCTVVDTPLVHMAAIGASCCCQVALAIPKPFQNSIQLTCPRNINL